MLEGVEDMIKKVAIENQLVGIDAETQQHVRVTKDTKFSVVLADYFNVVAGEPLPDKTSGRGPTL